MESRRDNDKQQVSESHSELGNRSINAEGGTLPGGSGGIQGRPESTREEPENQEGNQQSGLGGGPEPGEHEVEGDRGAQQKPGGHGDKSERRGGPTL